VSRPVLEPIQSRIQWVRGVLFLGVKRPELEADHLPQSCAEIKNVWSYTSIAQYTFMAWCSVKAQGQLYLYFHLKGIGFEVMDQDADQQRTLVNTIMNIRVP